MLRLLSSVAMTAPLAAVATDHTAPPGAEEMFQDFVHQFNRTYATLEERMARLNIFTANLEHIKRIQQEENGDAVYSHLSPFADESPEEFGVRFGHLASDPTLDRAAPEVFDVTNLPSNWDWEEKGAVNKIKNQGQCGSCWTFATAANIEGVGFVETGKLVSLSEEETLVCSDPGHDGCKGGNAINAYLWMIDKKVGLETEQEYPYLTKDTYDCKAVRSKEVSFISSWQQIGQDETQIQAALVQIGPLAIAVNAKPMQTYIFGIADPSDCDPNHLDHAVTLVGYGIGWKISGSKPFWLIRNSWGITWGQLGYWHLIRGKGACGMNRQVTTAKGVTVKSSVGDSIVV